MLDERSAVEQTRRLLGYHQSERSKLDNIRLYWKGRQRLPWAIPSTVPREVLTLAKIARVNACALVVETLTQSLFVEGFRDGRLAPSDVDGFWNVWQRNRFDARQSGVHRAAVAYGAAYVVVTPGDTAPVMRGVSPRAMTALYGEDPDWPMWALERWNSDGYRLYDEGHVYFIGVGERGQMVVTETREHGVRVHGRPVCPVVRFLEEQDLDSDDDVEGERGDDGLVLGQVAPMRPLQDQIDLTTFGLLVAQHYQSFRQRMIIGWVAESEAALAKASAAHVWTLDEDPEDVKVHEFAQVNLDGYIKSREASLRHFASLSQTPAHELIGELVNLSAEALAAAEAGRDRKVDERQTTFGEAWEQVAQTVGSMTGTTIPDNAAVRWRDTSARSFAATVDALGKAATLLGIPPQKLWERIPGVTQTDIDAWTAEFERGGVIGELQRTLDRQMGVVA